MPTNFNFAPASGDDGIIFGAERPGYPEKSVSDEKVSEWIRFMKSKSIERVVCLLGDEQLCHYTDLLEQYRRGFGTENVMCFSITDYTYPSAELLNERILPALRALKEQRTKTVVHCSAGKGRTGFVLAAYLVNVRGFRIADAVNAILDAGRSVFLPSHRTRGEEILKTCLP